METYHSGDVIGEADVLHNRDRSCAVAATTPSQVVVIDAALLFRCTCAQTAASRSGGF